MPIVEPWTQAENETLRELWAQKLSAAEIMQHLPGRTRNSILGRIHRLGLSSPKPNKFHPGAPKPKVKISPTRTYPTRPPIPMPALRDAPAVPRFIGIMDLADATCRYPMGEPTDDTFAYCGNHTQAGSSYCAAHHSLCYRPSPVAQDRRPGNGDVRSAGRGQNEPPVRVNF